jgi:hypothetical protein
LRWSRKIKTKQIKQVVRKIRRKEKLKMKARLQGRQHLQVEIHKLRKKKMISGDMLLIKTTHTIAE